MKQDSGRQSGLFALCNRGKTPHWEHQYGYLPPPSAPGPQTKFKSPPFSHKLRACAMKQMQTLYSSCVQS